MRMCVHWILKDIMWKYMLYNEHDFIAFIIPTNYDHVKHFYDGR